MAGSAAAFERFRQEAVSCGRAGKQVLVEKTAKHIMYLPKMFSLFPKTAKIIIMVRDGRDVALSIAKRYKRYNTSAFRICAEASRWILDNNSIRPYSNNTHILQVRYEDLVRDPEHTMHQIFDFLEGTPAPPEVLSQFKAASELKWGNVKAQQGDAPPNDQHGGLVNKHYRNWQVNQPLFDGRAQWAKHGTGLTDEQLREIYTCPMFTDLMISHGYLAAHNKSQWFDRVPRYM